jgi:hypothetical protein
MKNRKTILTLILSLGIFLSPMSAQADIFGGDVVVLSQILVNALQQLMQLKALLQTGSDTLSLLRDVNQGIKTGLSVVQLIDPTFNPGYFGNLNSPQDVLRALEDLYGKVPDSAEAKLLHAQDISIAEGIAMNGQLFQFADQADEESREILAKSNDVNPVGAAKLTAQSLAILIRVNSQVLRSNSMLLKMMSEQHAVTNRSMKLEAQSFRDNFENLSSGFGDLSTIPNLQPLGN